MQPYRNPRLKPTPAALGLKPRVQGGLLCSTEADMKKFGGTKPLFVIKQQCKAAGVAVDDYGFRTADRDYVCLGRATDKRPDCSPLVDPHPNSGYGYVMFNTFNGTFFGRTDKGVAFDSKSTEHEHEPWFQALLSFFYVEG